MKIWEYFGGNKMDSIWERINKVSVLKLLGRHRWEETHADTHEYITECQGRNTSVRSRYVGHLYIRKRMKKLLYRQLRVDEWESRWKSLHHATSNYLVNKQFYHDRFQKTNCHIFTYFTLKRRQVRLFCIALNATNTREECRWIPRFVHGKIYN